MCYATGSIDVCRFSEADRKELSYTMKLLKPSLPLSSLRAQRFVAPRQGVTGAIFMIGLAILFATDWFWPGILVLLGITSLVGAYIERSQPHDDIPLRVEEPLKELRYAAQCTSCGAATPPELQEGSTQKAAVCSYCGSPLELVQ